MTARCAIEQGMRKRTREYGQNRVVFATLTEPPKAGLDLPRFKHRWDATRKALARTWGVADYALVVEFQQRGALHPHVFLDVAQEVAEDLVDRKSRASYRRRMHELRPLAERLGWGQMVDAITVQGPDDSAMARYAAKQLAGYATKEAKERFTRAGAKHVRPTRLSYGWFEGGLAKARSVVLGSHLMAATKIEGEWERIPKPRTC